MGHKYFRVEYKNTQGRRNSVGAYPFGHVITYFPGKFLTVHTAIKDWYICDYCGFPIRRGDAYVRFHSIRNEDAGGTATKSKRCFTCIEKKILPEGIESVKVIE